MGSLLQREMRGVKSLRAFVVIAMSMATAMPCWAQQSSPTPYMEVGENRLAPLEFSVFCQRKPKRCAPSSDIKRVKLNYEHRSELEMIQVEVNHTIEPLVLLPNEPEQPWDDRATRGRCYDYALAKRTRLLDIGYPPSALLLALAFTPTNEGHLVLVVVTDRGDYIMDNLRLDMPRWDKLPYRWVMRSKPGNPLFWQAIVTPIVVGALADAGNQSISCN